jgi:hypothetical protein
VGWVTFIWLTTAFTSGPRERGTQHSGSVKDVQLLDDQTLIPSQELLIYVQLGCLLPYS